MGNEIVCPSPYPWYLDDLASLGFSISKSIYDGTFLLSFQVVHNQSKCYNVLKAYKSKEKETMSELEFIYEQFEKMGKINTDSLYGNHISYPFVTETGAYLMRSYLDTPLSDAISDEVPLSNVEKLWFSYQLIQAVKNLHNNNYIHGDIKPANIFISNGMELMLVDHAFFKPAKIGTKQTHYFIHFFCYNSGTAYIAPERITDDKDSEIDLKIADYFSIGCVLAFIFLKGVSLFNFSSLKEYKAGNDERLKLLNQIQDTNMKKLIFSLLDRNPESRKNATKNIDSYFPAFFTDFYQLFKKLQNSWNSVNKILSVLPDLIKTIKTYHIQQNIPNNDPNFLLLSNIISNAFRKSNTINSLSKLIDFYSQVIIYITDPYILLSKIIPPLVDIFSLNDVVISIRALDCIQEIFHSMKEIPTEFSSYFTAYFLPQLAHSVQFSNEQSFNEQKENCPWIVNIAIRLPFLLQNLSKLWPSIHHEFMKFTALFDILLPKRKEVISQKRKQVIHDFLANANRCVISSHLDYPLFKILCFIIFQLLNNGIFVNDIVAFVLNSYCHFSEKEKLTFEHDTLDSFLAALCAILSPTRNLPPCSYDNCLSIFYCLISFLESKRNCFTEPQLSLIATAAFRYLGNEQPEIKCLALRLSSLMPEFYSVCAIASHMFNISSRPTSEIVNNEKESSNLFSLSSSNSTQYQSHFHDSINLSSNSIMVPSFVSDRNDSTKINSRGITLQTIISQAQSVNSSILSNLPSTQRISQLSARIEAEPRRPNKAMPIQCNFWTGCRLDQGEIQQIIFNEWDYDDFEPIPYFDEEPKEKNSNDHEKKPQNMIVRHKSNDGSSNISIVEIDFHSQQKIKKKLSINSKDKFLYAGQTNDALAIISDVGVSLISAESLLNKNGQLGLSSQCNFHIQKGSIIENGILLKDNAALLYLNNGITRNIEIRDLETFKLITSPFFTDEIRLKCISSWVDSPLFGIGISNLAIRQNCVYVLDSRTGKPITSSAHNYDIESITTIPNSCMYGVMHSGGIEIYSPDLEISDSFCKVVGSITTSISCISKYEMEKSIVMLSRGGTYSLDFTHILTPTCHSLYDQGITKEIKPFAEGQFVLPEKNEQSLHSHKYPILCGAYNEKGRYICTGDSHGFINIWSPKQILPSY